MAAGSIIRTPQANLDLLEIWDYISEASEERADRVLDGINERCRMLAVFPQAGRERNDLIVGLRSLIVGNYVIFYQPIDDGIEVLRVLHGSRDVPGVFDEMIG